jgi:hypothetical protein
MKNPIDIPSIMKALSTERKIFHSEADFQFALAWKIKEMNDDKNMSIRLEYTPMLDNATEKKKNLWKNRRIDIVLFFNDMKTIVPIELKYLKETLKCSINDEMYNLSIGARGMGMYNCFADIERMEILRDNLKGFDIGYVIWLTNDKAYWEPKKENNYSEFHAPDGFTIEPGSKHFAKKAKVRSYKKYEDKITIKGTYPVVWLEYSDLCCSGKEKNRVFKYCEICVEK